MTDEKIKEYKEQLNQNPGCYRVLPEEARNNDKVTSHALDKDPFNMWYIGEQLKNNADFVTNTMGKTHTNEIGVRCFVYPTFHMNKVGEKLQGNRDVVLHAMEFNETFDLKDLEHACKYFINDKEVMGKAMKKLQENPIMVLGEIKIGRAMVASYMGKNKAIEEIKNDPEIYRLLSAELKKNPEVALTAIQKEPYYINEIPKELKTVDFYTRAIKERPGLYRILDGDMRKDTKIAMTAIQKEPSLIKEIPQELRSKNFYTAAAMSIPGVKEYLPKHVARAVEQEIEKLKPKDLHEALLRAQARPHKEVEVNDKADRSDITERNGR